MLKSFLGIFLQKFQSLPESPTRSMFLESLLPTVYVFRISSPISVHQNFWRSFKQFFNSSNFQHFWNCLPFSEHFWKLPKEIVCRFRLVEIIFGKIFQSLSRITKMKCTHFWNILKIRFWNRKFRNCWLGIISRLSFWNKLVHIYIREFFVYFRQLYFFFKFKFFDPFPSSSNITQKHFFLFRLAEVIFGNICSKIPTNFSESPK